MSNQIEIQYYLCNKWFNKTEMDSRLYSYQNIVHVVVIKLREILQAESPKQPESKVPQVHIMFIDPERHANDNDVKQFGSRHKNCTETRKKAKHVESKRIDGISRSSRAKMPQKAVTTYAGRRDLAGTRRIYSAMSSTATNKL